MSYMDQFQLSNDSDFLSRTWAALASEAVVKPADDPVARYLLPDPYLGVKLFMPYISTAPGFGDKYATGGQEAITDPELLSAIQVAWTRVVVPS